MREKKMLSTKTRKFPRLHLHFEMFGSSLVESAKKVTKVEHSSDMQQQQRHHHFANAAKRNRRRVFKKQRKR
jgi:hypothetical protein